MKHVGSGLETRGSDGGGRQPRESPSATDRGLATEDPDRVGRSVGADGLAPPFTPLFTPKTPRSPTAERRETPAGARRSVPCETGTAQRSAACGLARGTTESRSTGRVYAIHRGVGAFALVRWALTWIWHLGGGPPVNGMIHSANARSELGRSIGRGPTDRPSF